jgi:uncharacterized protein involved in exopolysaccharide biosynthesis
MLNARKAEEARLADALDKERISNVVLAEAPVSPLVSTRPPLLFVLLVGGIAGLMLGVISALIIDWLGAGQLPSRRLQAAFAQAPAQAMDGEAEA